MFDENPGRTRGPSRPDNLKTLTRDTFDALVLEGSGPIAVEFMSYGCAHCRMLEPIIQQVAAKLKGQEAVFRVNTAAQEGLAVRYEIEGTPTLILFRDGKIVGRSEGPSPNVANILAVVTQPFNT
jgi:thioredoxin 1